MKEKNCHLGILNVCRRECDCAQIQSLVAIE